MRALKNYSYLLRYLCVAISTRTTKSFQIELMLANWNGRTNFVRLEVLDFDFVYNLQVFNILIPKKYSIRIKGEAEHSRLRPDIRAVLFLFTIWIRIHIFFWASTNVLSVQHSSRFRGGGGGRLPPSGIRTPADPKDPALFCTILRYLFLVKYTKKFSKAPWAPT